MTLQTSGTSSSSSQITILQNADGHFLAEQQPRSNHSAATTIILVVVGFALIFAYKRQWKMLWIPAVGSLLLIPFLGASNNPVYRIEVDQRAHEITSEKLVKGAVVEHTVLPANTITSAEMQFDRGKRTIVLINKDGQQIFPLGEERLVNQPDQYVILNVLRSAIGQTPVAPQ